MGVGVDGHIAALYPNSPSLQESSEWVLSISDKAPERISLGLHVINNSKRKMVALAGPSKADMVNKVFRGGTMTNLPASLLKGDVKWYMDKSAASKLNNE